MKAKLVIGTDDVIRVFLYPTTEAEILILLKLAENKTAEIKKIDRDTPFYASSIIWEIESVCLTPQA